MKLVNVVMMLLAVGRLKMDIGIFFCGLMVGFFIGLMAGLLPD